MLLQNTLLYPAFFVPNFSMMETHSLAHKNAGIRSTENSSENVNHIKVDDQLTAQIKNPENNKKSPSLFGL
jgi:hypothetical protein